MGGYEPDGQSLILQHHKDRRTFTGGEAVGVGRKPACSARVSWRYLNASSNRPLRRV